MKWLASSRSSMPFAFLKHWVVHGLARYGWLATRATTYLGFATGFAAVGSPRSFPKSTNPTVASQVARSCSTPKPIAGATSSSADQLAQARSANCHSVRETGGQLPGDAQAGHDPTISTHLLTRHNLAYGDDWRPASGRSRSEGIYSTAAGAWPAGRGDADWR